jgi:hypothetical protein
VCAVTSGAGEQGHFSRIAAARIVAALVARLFVIVDITQWCLPSFRQQAGRFVSTALAAKSGEISGKRNSTIRKVEMTLRTRNL